MKQSTPRNNSFEKKHNRSNSKNNGNNHSKKSTAASGISSTTTSASPSVEPSNVVTSQINQLNNEELQGHMQDRLLFLIVNSIGAQINVLTNSGVVVKGILHNIDPKTLKIIIKNNDEVNKDNLTSFNYEDLLEFELENIDLFNTNYISKAQSSFKTDKDIGISRNNTPRQEMEKWVPDQSISPGVSLDSLSLNDDDKKWDQFATNEEKFGIVSEFDEHLYTTRINKNDPDYQKKLEKANKLAAEIEGQSFNGNIHLAEERGLKFDDSGIDEEDKYSGVDRSIDAKGDALFQSLINKDSRNFQFGDGSQQNSKYLPPSQRSKIQNIDPSIVSASKNKQQTSSVSPPKQHTSIPAKPKIEEKSSNDIKKSSIPDHLKKINTINEINSLKEFSQTFKVPTKFPEDLLPILAKDKLKQEEIKKKLENKQPSASASPKPTSSSTAKPTPNTSSKPSTPASTPATTTTTTSTTTTTTGKKIGDPAKAQTFKLNPKAASFTPSSATTPSSTSNVSTPVFSKNSPRLASTQSGYNNRPKRYNITPASFFGHDKIPNADKPRKNLNKDFNFFRGCLNEYENKKRASTEKEHPKFFLERPFVTPPTWIKEDVEKPYSSFFPDLDPLKFQRFAPPQPGSGTPAALHQQFQPFPIIQQQPQFFYPPQPFIPQQQFMALSPQSPNNTQLTSPTSSPFQQHQRPIYPHQPYQGGAPYQGYYPSSAAAGVAYQPNRYATGSAGGYPNYPQGSGIPTPVIPLGQLQQPQGGMPPPPNSGHHQGQQPGSSGRNGGGYNNKNY